VKKLFKVRRCIQLPGNATGRDLVVGDLHGHRALLERVLDRLEFDPRCDRVFSVGDLIDRGPESLATLSLIEQPWFHAVLGNHELMLLNFVHCYASRLHSRKAYPSGAGEWITEAVSRHRRAVEGLVERVSKLPLAIHVGGEVPFSVTHGDLPPTNLRHNEETPDETICVHKADHITSSREKMSAALKTDLMALRFAQHSVRISPTPMADIPITYAGHSPVRDVTVHNSYVYIDQGVCARTSKQAGRTSLTVLDHRKFAYWLGGVASARGQATQRVLRQPDNIGASTRSPALA
jgi:serine/threonine protein phosphatase 1